MHEISDKQLEFKSVKIFDKFELSKQQKEGNKRFVPKFLSISNIQEESEELDQSRDNFRNNQTGGPMGKILNPNSKKRMQTVYKNPQPAFKPDIEQTRNFKKSKKRVSRNGHKKSKSLIDHNFIGQIRREVSESRPI